MPRIARKLWIVALAIIVLLPVTAVGAWAVSVAYYYQVTWQQKKQQRKQFALHQANHPQIRADCHQMLSAPHLYPQTSGQPHPTNLPASLASLNATSIQFDSSGVMLTFDREWGLWVPAPGSTNPGANVPGFNSRLLIPGLWYYEIHP